MNAAASQKDFEHLLRFGGFPEPCLTGNQRHWNRWQNEHRSRVVQEDIVWLEQVKDVTQMDLLASILPARVGSVLSVNNLRQDLGVAFVTADRWIGILENIYYCFRISPYGFSTLRTAQKEKKLYLWDWSLVEQPSARFENLVASHLLKYCHWKEDHDGQRLTLRFFRDSTGREIDFIVCKGQKPLFAVECKTGETGLSKTIEYASVRLPVPRFYQVHLGKKHAHFPAHRAEILPFRAFAKEIGV